MSSLNNFSFPEEGVPLIKASDPDKESLMKDPQNNSIPTE
jgi:hypothetical protein